MPGRGQQLVATGSSALLPDIPGLREAQPWTSREAAAASKVPGRLAIIGGGVVASEMATAYASLGSVVTCCPETVSCWSDGHGPSAAVSPSPHRP
jgi:dihydrolipoamide dehydrogenase